jgi:hypothetical protein
VLARPPRPETSEITLAESQLALLTLSSLCVGEREAVVLLRRLLAGRGRPHCHASAINWSQAAHAIHPPIHPARVTAANCAPDASAYLLPNPGAVLSRALRGEGRRVWGQPQPTARAQGPTPDSEAWLARACSDGVAAAGNRRGPSPSRRDARRWRRSSGSRRTSWAPRSGRSEHSPLGRCLLSWLG